VKRRQDSRERFQTGVLKKTHIEREQSTRFWWKKVEQEGSEEGEYAGTVRNIGVAEADTNLGGGEGRGGGGGSACSPNSGLQGCEKSVEGTIREKEGKKKAEVHTLYFIHLQTKRANYFGARYAGNRNERGQLRRHGERKLLNFGGGEEASDRKSTQT